MSNPTRSTQDGFTLIELLMAMAIIAILVSVSYPSYQQYLEQSRRTDGQAALLDLANRMEDYYAEHQTYASATLATGDPETDILPSSTSPALWYNLNIVTQDDRNYLIQATPQKAQANDKACQSLTLNSLGEKGITIGPEGTPTSPSNTCW